MQRIMRLPSAPTAIVGGFAFAGSCVRGLGPWCGRTCAPKAEEVVCARTRTAPTWSRRSQVREFVRHRAQPGGGSSEERSEGGCRAGAEQGPQRRLGRDERRLLAQGRRVGALRHQGRQVEEGQALLQRRGGAGEGASAMGARTTPPKRAADRQARQTYDRHDDLEYVWKPFACSLVCVAQAAGDHLLTGMFDPQGLRTTAGATATCATSRSAR